MDIFKREITQIVIVHYNEIPFSKLTLKKYIDQITKRFQFASVNALQTIQEGRGDVTSAIVWNNGLFEGEERPEIPITRIQLEDRKIILQLEGSSEDAVSLYDAFVEELTTISGSSKEEYLQPIVKSFESDLVVQLNIPINGLFNQQFLNFINNNVVNASQSEIADTVIRPSDISFQLDYFPKEKSLLEHKIVLSSKKFLIEPALGYPIAEQIVHSKAPFDTNTHIRLLEELEGVML